MADACAGKLSIHDGETQATRHDGRWVDEQVVTHQGLVSSRGPDDLPRPFYAKRERLAGEPRGPSYGETDHGHEWSRRSGGTAAHNLVRTASALAA